MRHFTYLDNDLLYSFFSQAYDGLDQFRQYEKSDSASKAHHDEQLRLLGDLKGSIGWKIFGANGGFEGETKYPYDIFTETQVGREMVTKTLHDNIVQYVINNLKDNSMICELKSPDIGMYICQQATVKYADIEFLLNLLNDNFINFCEKYNKGVSSDTLKNIREVLVVANTIMPFTCFGYTKNAIIPLNKDALKESIQHCIYKHDGKSYLLGRVSKKGLNPQNYNSENNIDKMISSISDATKAFIDMFGIKDPNELTVVTPMAIFYE